MPDTAENAHYVNLDIALAKLLSEGRYYPWTRKSNACRLVNATNEVTMNEKTVVHEMALYVPGYLHNTHDNPIPHLPSIYYVSPDNFEKVRVEYDGAIYSLTEMESMPTNDYDRGFEFGRYVKAERDQGENPDSRFTIADEAKMLSAPAFKEYMRGLKDGMAGSAD